MSNALSFPMWLLLVALIGVPIHILVNKAMPRLRAKHEISSSVTMTLVMALCLIVLPLINKTLAETATTSSLLAQSCLFGVAFGVPCGLLLRALFRGSGQDRMSAVNQG